MTCIAGERLAAYWLGELDEVDAAAVEEHVFECDACADAFSKTSSVIAAVRAMVPPVITGARLRELNANVPALKQVAVAPGGSALVDFGPNDVLFALHLQADLARAERVDFTIELPNGAKVLELQGAPFDAASGTVIVLCQRHFVSSPGAPTLLHMRLRTLRDGAWSESGLYTVDHVISS